jgi:hypothetical protein
MNEGIDEVRLWERKAVAVLASILSAAFLAWAGVVWNSADKVLMRIDRMSDQLAADRVEQQLYRAQVERRLSIVEERQNRVIRVLDKLERVSDEGPQ